MSRLAKCLRVAVVAWAVVAPGRASAATDVPSAGDGVSAKDAARACFDRGLTASNEQRFGDAIAEFERAYALWPDFHVLYNIGKVRVALGRSAGASDAFRAYLEKAGDQIDAERRREVQGAIARLEQRVAMLTVRVSDDGADVRLDGRLLGVSPLAGPVRVDEGRHTIEALVPARPGQLRELDLPGATATEVVLEFPSLAPKPTPVLSAPVPKMDVAAPALVQTAPRAPARPSRVVGYVVGGAGLVATVVGAVLAYEGATDANAARARLVDASMPAPPGVPDLGKYNVAKAAYDDAKTQNELGWALVGAGGAALVSGGALAFVWAGASGGVRGSW